MFGGKPPPTPPKDNPGAQTALEGVDDTKIVRYRRERLVEAGYDFPDAKYLARRLDVDLHQALSLRYRGCDSLTARRILA